MKRWVIGMLLVLVACGGGGGGNDCEPVSSVLLDAISTGLTVGGGGTLRDGFAVPSPDLELIERDVWFVAAEIDGPGMEGDGEVGVWVTNTDPSVSSDADIHLILAVNSLAREFSDWGADVQATAFVEAARNDPGAEEALACVGG